MQTDKNRIDGENKNLSRKGNASFRYIRNKRELIFRTGTTIFQLKGFSRQVWVHTIKVMVSQ